MHQAAKVCFAAATAAVLSASAVQAAPASVLPAMTENNNNNTTSVSSESRTRAEDAYRTVLEKRELKSLLPTSDEAEAMLTLDEEMYTADAWMGMKRCVAVMTPVGPVIIESCSCLITTI